MAESNDNGDRLYGDVVLVAGTNIRLSTSLDFDGSHRVRIDAIAGEGLNEECACVDAFGPPIRRINGVSPTFDGNFTFLGNDCVEVSTITNGLRLNDICSKACCGCDELEVITQDLQLFGNEANTVRDFVSRLEAQNRVLSTVILGSRISDDRCDRCSEVLPP